MANYFHTIGILQIYLHSLFISNNVNHIFNIGAYYPQICLGEFICNNQESGLLFNMLVSLWMYTDTTILLADYCNATKVFLIIFPHSYAFVSTSLPLVSGKFLPNYMIFCAILFRCNYCQILVVWAMYLPNFVSKWHWLAWFP